MSGLVKPLTVLSMGYGVQTITLGAMMALDEYPRADFSIFADTHHEGQGTYAAIRWWTPWFHAHGLTVVTVEGKRTEVVREDWHASVLIPAHTLEAGIPKGQTQRQCTGDWKIAPIRRWIRGELKRRGVKRLTPGIVESWQGISLDEWYRMGDSDVKYITHRNPLVDLRMTRMDCITWLESHNLPVPPKSACTFCPFHESRTWKELKRRGGDDWREAVEVDAAIRNKRPGRECYVHPARLPLSKAVRIPEDVGAFQPALGLCENGYCRT